MPNYLSYRQMSERPRKYKKSKEQKEKERKARLEKERERKKHLKEKERKKEQTRKARNKRRREKARKERREYLKQQQRLAKLTNSEVKVKKTADYKIVFVGNGSQIEYVGKYYTIQDAYEAFNNITENREPVIYPKRVMNSNGNHPAVYEYLLLEKNHTSEERTTQLRNEYGKMIEHATNNPKWTIIDKRQVEVEESFWVYGYDPRYDRKCFLWIYESLIKNPIIEGCKYENKLITLYGNKILIKSDDGKLDMVITKTRSEGIRFYNKISEYIEKDRINKNVLMLGSFSRKDKAKENLVSEIEQLTGWDRKKIVRMTTSG